jgi:hypothetical protein
MAGPCTAAFERLAGELGGFSCEGANPIVNLHNPLTATNWTLPAIEAVMIVGSLLSLRHAVRRKRAGDPTGLALWLGALVYLAIVEPPLYFPDVFGLTERVGLIFVHNEFTVQFLFNRLPLYIVALYPAMVYLAYELVRVAGVFDRRGAFVSAVCVGFVHQCFYEIFDHLGPQLRWWIWNPDAPTNQPALASVPVSSMVVFGAIGPCALTFLVRTLVARRIGPDGSMPTTAFVGRTLAVGALVPLGLVIGALPASVFGIDPMQANHPAQAIAYGIELAAFAVVGTLVLADAHRHPSRAGPADHDRYVTVHGALYLVALAALWLTALPAYLGARDGVTGDGTPIGSLPYALACLAAAGVIVAAASSVRRVPARGAVEDGAALTG